MPAAAVQELSSGVINELEKTVTGQMEEGGRAGWWGSMSQHGEPWKGSGLGGCSSSGTPHGLVCVGGVSGRQGGKACWRPGEGQGGGCCMCFLYNQIVLVSRR